MEERVSITSQGEGVHLSREQIWEEWRVREGERFVLTFVSGRLKEVHSSTPSPGSPSAAPGKGVVSTRDLISFVQSPLKESSRRESSSGPPQLGLVGGDSNWGGAEDVGFGGRLAGDDGGEGRRESSV